MSAPPLVAHVITHLFMGGMENGLVNLISRMPPERYRHAIICLKGWSDFRDRLRRPDVELVSIDKQEGKDPASYLRLWRVLRRLRPAIVHTRNIGTIDAVVPAALAGVRRRVHGEHGWDVHDLRGSSRKYRLLRRALRPLIARFISVSRDLDEYLAEAIGVPESRRRQIYNGVDTERFRPAEAAGAARSALPAGFAPPGAVVVGNVGRMQMVKDPLVLVDAFLRLAARDASLRERARLVLVGDGPLYADARRAVQAAAAADRIWLPGAREDIPELLRAFDVFVLPSLNEGISNTVLEAMASGLPVIATRVGGNPELVADDETGRLVAPSDPEGLASAIAEYVVDSARREEEGREARRRAVERFSLDAMVAAYAAVYDEVLEGRRAG